MSSSRLAAFLSDEVYSIQQIFFQPVSRRTVVLAGSKLGFTIVELLIVIVVIGILATIVIVAYNGITTRANNERRNADMSLYYKAIIQAQQFSGKNLRTITGSSYSAGQCTGTSTNPSGTEPKDLPKTSVCWTRYYDNLAKIGAAANLDLTKLQAGDARGNPYLLDENEGENGNCTNQDSLLYMSGSGVGTTLYKRVPLAGDCS